ncbi:mitochondrial protein [Kwoniella heveanensis CBS 569]|uniref:Mitochondrial protein n=1 Tax=Kwoniella heveanensis BCC8398 TaxID=1296120 RepID=A0A1B9H1W8_9TREE|nr:mitochondrial protein [Kwoniella heveanensis BCC8398]OCF45924.1 mitochondrial protein [Kwoniella heveanensis CBS 569]
MKVFENEILFNYPPAQTIAALHRKYPNPFATHVYSVDTLERTIDPESGVLRSERLIGVQQGAPKWITKLFHLPPTAYVREVVFVDPSDPSATCMSVNLSLAQYVSCLELIRYYPTTPTSPSSPTTLDSADSSTTTFSQRAMLISGFPTKYVARKLEQASYDRFKANAGIGKQGFDWVLAGGNQAALPRPAPP